MDGVTTTDAPRELTIFRPDSGIEVSWLEPSNTDGRTLLGYWLYRTPSSYLWDPTFSDFVDAPATSYFDAGAYNKGNYLYYIQATYENPTTLEITHSIVSGPVVAIFVAPVDCAPVEYDAGSPSALLETHSGCVDV